MKTISGLHLAFLLLHICSRQMLSSLERYSIWRSVVLLAPVLTEYW